MAAVNCPVTFPILEFTSACGLITFWTTLIVILVGTAAVLTSKFSHSIESTRPLQEQLRRLEVAHELVEQHTTAQKAELVQLRLDNEELRALVDAVTLTNKSQAASLQHTKQKLAALEKQNDALANKLMASRRQVFRLEQEKLGHEVLLQEIGHIKTLMKDNIHATNGLNEWISTKCIKSGKRNGGRALKDRARFSPCSGTGAVSTASTYAGQSDQDTHNYAALSHPSECTSSSLLSLSTSSENRNTPSDAPTSAAKTEQILKKRLFKKIELAFVFCRARGWFEDGFDVTRCGYEPSKRVGSAAGFEALMEIACG